MNSCARSTWGVLVVILGVSFTPPALAKVALASVFTDNAVLQRGRPLPVWGSAGANARVEVMLGDHREVTTAGADGSWKVVFKALEAGGEPLELRAASAGREAAARGVLIGDVWLCAGQSNMQMGLRESEGGEAAVRGAGNQKRLRLLTVPKWPADQPQASMNGAWRECTPDTAASFSAVGFYFAAALRQAPELGEVPIGLIDCSFGGTTVEAWTSPAALRPFRREELLDSMFGIKPGHIYNGMVAPLSPFAVRGVLWYQGEANTSRAELYPRLLSAMIADWRERWGQAELPFLVVQLPPFTDPRFAWVRAAQAEVARTVPKVGLAVTIDTTDGFDLHPRQKREIGERLALLARQIAYGEKLVARGPVFTSARAEGAALRVKFDTGGDELAAGAGGAVKGFAVAGKDGVFRFAEASIEGDEVVVRSDAVSDPQSARYAWAGMPGGNLTNRSGLPAAPFRTDDLPLSGYELQRPPAGRHISTPSYAVEVSGAGKVVSLVVGGKQFLSNAPGAAGGTSIPGFLGPRQLEDLRAMGPELLSCSDSEVTLLLQFKERAMEWRLSNRGKGELEFHIALATKVDVSSPEGDGRVTTLSRGKSTITIGGVDSVKDGEDGKVIHVVLKPGTTRTISFGVGRKER